MKNLNQIIYEKLIIQAKEAKVLGFEKLADGVISSIGPVSRDENEKITYSSIELKEDLYKKLWKIAIDVIAYHDLESVDIQKIDDAISHISFKILDDIEASLDVSKKIGKLEPKLPGQF